MTTNEKELAILDCNLVVEGDFTVNGTIYNVYKIEDLHKVEGFTEKLKIPSFCSSKEQIYITNLTINGDFIICNELQYEITINGYSLFHYYISHQHSLSIETI